MNEEYWPMSEISFTKAQMWWLINHLEELHNGNWPEKPSSYVQKPKMACAKARKEGYEGYCIACPYVPCLNPGERTPNRVRKERNINRVLEIAAEVESRLELVMNYISGWQRPDRKIEGRLDKARFREVK